MNLSVSSLPVKKYAVSFAAAFIITVVLEAVVSLVFTFLPPKDWLLDVIHNYSSYFSAFVAAFLCAKKCGKRGFLTGMVSAIIYMAILFALGGILFKSSIDTAALPGALALCAGCGAVGGIVGINCK